MNPYLSDAERTRVVELKTRGYSDNTTVELLEDWASPLINLLSIAYGIVGNLKEHSTLRMRQEVAILCIQSMRRNSSPCIF